MRIATWNVNGLRSRLEFVLHWLAARQPDVVGLQELKLTDEQFPYDELAAAGYRAAVHGQKAWNGVAILSREPGEVTRRGLPGQEELGSRLVTARFGELSFTTVYCPNGKSVGHEDYPRKLGWYDGLAAHWAATEAPARLAVLCGDFNVCPADLDSHHAPGAAADRIFHTAAERARFGRLLEGGLVDLYRDRYPETRMYSWWDYRGGAFHRNLGLRIDFVLATPALAARVRDVVIARQYRKKKDGFTASDHAPVYADLD
ncbi:MAG: exodeoxyribonuclease III [Acidobacteriota bacterium]|nr:exodeoxyribonuclease III [Acidobacteriota bacterium]